MVAGCVGFLLGASAATRPFHRLRLLSLQRFRVLHRAAAGTQSKGEALFVFFLAAADEHVVHTAHTRGHGLDGGGRQHQNAQRDPHRAQHDHSDPGQQRHERSRKEIAENAATSTESGDAVGRGGHLRGHGCDARDAGDQDADAEGDPGVGTHQVGTAEHAQRPAGQQQRHRDRGNAEGADHHGMHRVEEPAAHLPPFTHGDERGQQHEEQGVAVAALFGSHLPAGHADSADEAADHAGDREVAGAHSAHR